MRTVRGWAFILFLIALLCAATSACGENLLENGRFEDAYEGWPVGWEADMWRFDDGTSYLERVPGGVDGGSCALIENVASNDARFVQNVPVEAGALYRLSGYVRAEGVGEGFTGATLSVLGAYETFPDLRGDAPEWTLLECYLLTDDGQTSLDVCARLGGYSNDNVGKAWFDDLRLERVHEVPEGAAYILLTNPSKYQYAPAESEPEKASNPLDRIPLLLALFLLLIAALWLWRVRPKNPPRLALPCLLLAAAAIRLWMMATVPGYETDVNCFYSWSRTMAQVGPGRFYDTVSFCDYPPGYMYVLWLNGLLFNLFGVAGTGSDANLILRFVPLLCDLATVSLLFHALKEKPRAALSVAALYALSPAVLLDGAAWGQIDSVLALGLLATVLLAGKGRWRFALPVYALTALVKPQALMIAPVGLAALVVWIIQNKNQWREALVGLIASVLTAAIVLLPFAWGRPISWIFSIYAETLGSYEYATLNTMNLYYLLGMNWAPLSGGLATLGTAVIALLCAGAAALYLLRRDRLALICALLLAGLYLFGVKMHERYLFPALALLALAYAKRPDKRVLAAFVGFSITLFINCFLVLRDTHLPLAPDFFGIALSAINLLLFGLLAWAAIDKRAMPLAVPAPVPRAQTPVTLGETPPSPRMKGLDWLLMLGLTGVYAAIALIGLGSTIAPQTVWQSTGANEIVTFDLGESRAFNVMLYPGVNGRDHTLTLAFSEDGERWSDSVTATVEDGSCFQWMYAWADGAHQGRYARLTADGPSLALMEIAFRDEDGNALPVASVTSEGFREGSRYDPTALVDEADTMPDAPSYFNSMYFDEIYHGRTGYEHLHGMSTYEWTHPPLGKLFIMLGIRLFGMTPFGWRFAGAMAGVLMLPAMYLLGKLLFKRTRLAFLAAFLMAFDMMHLTQTRIATIDSYAVLFIILMYLCMFRYMQMSFFRDGWRTLIPLGLSGLFMGLGCASKWIGFYAGAGLALLFFWSLARRFIEWKAFRETDARVEGFPTYALGTLAACVLFFIVIPFAIYYFSYIRHFAWEGGLTWKRFWETQESILWYHGTLVDNHAFQSPWYEWPLILKPMYYFSGRAYAKPGMISSIMCMGNPAVWWTGLAAVAAALWKWARRLWRGGENDPRLGMLLVALAAQFLPWVLVPRSMFIYHYFASLPFVMLCVCLLFERARNALLYGFMGMVLALFILFYPIATGVQVPLAWGHLMNWFSFLKLPGWQYRGWLYF